MDLFFGRNGSVFMIIDASNFIDGETKEVSFSENILIPGNYCVDNNADVKVTGEISNEKGKFHLSGRFSQIFV